MRDDLETMLDAIVSDGWAEETTGTVDAPAGHVALLDLEMAGPDLMVKRDELGLTMTDDDVYALEGWWIVTTTDQGLIYGDRYDDEDGARDHYARAEESYALWDDQDEETI